MSNPVTCNITGLKELQVKLEALAENVATKGMRGALKDGGDVVVDQMEMRAPDHTGFLRSHFGKRISMHGHGDLAGSVFIGPDKAIYPKGMTDRVLTETLKMNKKQKKEALRGQKGRISCVSVCRFLEFGTSKMAKHPFMTAAFKSVSSKALSAVIKALKAAVEGV